MVHKFRCWDGSEYYRPIIDEEGRTFLHSRDFEYDIDNHDVLQLYSGLRDAFGIEIYEGDRITHERDTGTVYFDQGAFRVKWDEPVSWEKRTLLYFVNDQCVVKSKREVDECGTR